MKEKKISQNKRISISGVPQNPWSMSQEREFIENLLCQRFSFFIVFYSIIVAASSLTLESQTRLVVILILGSVILTLFATTLFRAQHKLDLILKEIFKISTHPTTVINNLAKDTKIMPWYARFIASGSRRKFIGYTIPAFCVFSLILGAVLAVLDMLP